MDEEGGFVYFDVRIEGLTMFVQIDIFSKDAIILPVNHSNTHWTSAAINFRKKRIEYYDSLGSKSPMVYRVR